MNIAGYNAILADYKTAWNTVRDLRNHVQQADVYLKAYGVRHQASELQFHINPRAHVDTLHWPTADDILQAVNQLKAVGEQAVSAFNHLTKEDRYLVKLPPLLELRD
jgi:hypothetical protein